MATVVDPHLPAAIVFAFCVALAVLGVAGHIAERAAEHDRLAADEPPEEQPAAGRHWDGTDRIRVTLLMLEYRRDQRDRLSGG